MPATNTSGYCVMATAIMPSGVNVGAIVANMMAVTLVSVTMTMVRLTLSSEIGVGQKRHKSAI